MRGVLDRNPAKLLAARLMGLIAELVCSRPTYIGRKDSAARMFTIEFGIGLVLGAVFGVVVDRLWARFEERPRLQLRSGYFEKIEGVRGINCTVRNVGRANIPDYRIALFHPSRGSTFAFSAEDSGPLLPDQERLHECLLSVQGKPCDYFTAWLALESSGNAPTADPKDYEFRVVMSKSDRVLFSSKPMGRALADIWRATARGDEFSTPSLLAMASPSVCGLRQWWYRNRLLWKAKKATRNMKGDPSVVEVFDARKNFRYRDESSSSTKRHG